MKKLMLFIIMLVALTPVFADQLIINGALSTGKDTLNNNPVFGSVAVGYTKDKRMSILAAEMKGQETTFSLLAKWNIGRQTDTRISQYEQLRYIESRDMFSLFSFTSAYFYYDVSSSYSNGLAMAFTFENKGDIRLGTNLVAGIYGKMSIINDVKNPVFSVAPFALIDVYLSFYDKVRLQTELTTGSIFYLPTNFAYELTFMLNVELMKDLSIGASLTTGLADNFTETFFSNRFEYSTFVNWGYTL